MAEKLIEVGRFFDSIDAALLRNRLVAAGVDAVLADDETVTMTWLYSNAIGGVKVLVPESQVEQAADVLEDDTVLESLPEEMMEDEGEESEDEAEEPADKGSTEAAAEEKPEPSQLTDEEEDAPEPELTRRETEAERAYKAAVFGLLFYPLQAYACWLLVRVFFADERLAGLARRHAWIAAAINIPLFVLPMLLLVKLLLQS